MKKINLLLLIIVLFAACSDQTDHKDDSYNDSSDYESGYYSEEGEEPYVEEYEEEAQIYNGEYCAEITYYNSNTGRESEYTLIIEVYENELERINFPNGWLDDENYGYVEFDEDGYVSFTSYKGYDYTVQIIGEASGCYENVPEAVQCLGTTEDGDQCERLTDNPTGYCWQHEDQED